VLKLTDTSARIHFIGESKQFDEWILLSSGLIQVERGGGGVMRSRQRRKGFRV